MSKMCGKCQRITGFPSKESAEKAVTSDLKSVLGGNILISNCKSCKAWHIGVHGSMPHSLRARIGFLLGKKEKSSVVRDRMKRRAEYKENPVKCHVCSKSLTYEQFYYAKTEFKVCGRKCSNVKKIQDKKDVIEFYI